MHIEFHKQGIIIEEKPVRSLDDIHIYSWGKVCQFIAASILGLTGFYALTIIIFTL